MRLTRAWVDAVLAPGMRLALPEDAAAHLLRALRLDVGDSCVLFNGDGHDYDARVVAAGKRGGEVEVLAARVVDAESPLRIILLQGVARGEKMDWILQKATELGVAGFVPVNSERSEVRLDAARSAKRVQHWQGVVASACGQSGRARLPSVAAPLGLAEAMASLPGDALRVTLDPGAVAGIHALAMPASATVVVGVGPEGGWSPRDREQLVAAGFSGVRLGPRILRTETAGIAAISVLQAAFGDLR
ncbi:16S rRNA (uracil(1498)-N(3))-methyltransferase [Luteimonas sp. MC1572]|uniref:16S rRNA (uracil(1498)-N(3))-methyltransferase n=1 Tax=Luteimonas sp. MC1572 TaxID=2799325 RepID=UPI0018F0AC20|nr:16S rRNA (uracil(1498)-N(3))-methyltransferase [Luteimonas sp. MC1572]MBJ6981297.1 16S rRNA (uracil(1498)-N(3))-methyltransferase [Luteimonas sp. MC1572]QQO02617.1 16S rRNA (uracil(1498)-N(3))-methyltransferase [Luteimonas sp. MC1572]